MDVTLLSYCVLKGEIRWEKITQVGKVDKVAAVELLVVEKRVEKETRVSFVPKPTQQA